MVDEPTTSSYGTVTTWEHKDQTSYVAWLQALAIVAVNSTCTLMWCTGAGAPGSVSIWLDVSLTKVNWLSNASAIFNTIFSLVTAWFYERFGLKKSIMLAACSNMIGCWIRCIAIWLPVEKRYSMHYGLHRITVAWPTHSSLFGIAILSTAAAVPTVFLPIKPKIAASVTALADRLPFWTAVKQLARIPAFWCVAWLSSIVMGMTFSISVLIMEAIVPYGYTEQQAGVCAAVIVLLGFLGGVIPNAFSVILAACALNGFLSYALIPIYLELASEMSYPIPESISACIIWSFATLFMLIFSVIIDMLRAGPEAIPPYNMDKSMIAAAAMMLVSSIPCIWLKGDLKRLSFDRQ
ncbi:uncharacterized protein BYT42DRAFT_593777 [Radiomyces spectabilis]|uniref:uncharacterized protein n=1 Tax=Radiomyces spectabilis TaxID=64574 RepID=UPI00221F7837|nr:uncharacterized protein BYT42DRAFT_593777 [Radiomyces spectabilis]KAI8377521.1 hypothetical protein BYT42DRAFT_593777 [Radiomyces spectabilis]